MNRQAVVLAVGVVCLAVFILPGVGAPPPPGPQPVSVVNFPAVQPVSGTVQVGNLPAVQNVAGTVSVGNLPLDAEGNVRIAGAASCAPPTIRYVGITQEAFTYNLTLYAWSRACSAEFPGTRACEVLEVARSIPPPPEWAAGGALAFRYVTDNVGQPAVDNACLNNAGAQNCSNLPPMIPVACCGY